MIEPMENDMKTGSLLTPEEISDALRRREIEIDAKALIDKARRAGFNVVIETRALTPLAMRNYELQVTVWPAR